MSRRSSGTAAIGLLVVLLVAAAQADEQLERAHRRDQLRECRTLLKEALPVIEDREYDSALVLLRAADACDPGNPDIAYHQARVAVYRADTNTAIEILHRGITQRPLVARLKVYLARVLVARGEYGEAISLIDGVLQIQPREGEARYLKGIILLAQADTAAAIAEWEQAAERASAGTIR